MNILYIHTHDSGRVLSPYGYKIPTDNLLKFSEDALVFEKAFTASPTCSPSRGALLTGMYPHSNGLIGLSQRGFEIKDYGKHLVNFLKNKGYRTVLCGIQHEAGKYLESHLGKEIIGYEEDITTDGFIYEQEELIEWDRRNSYEACRWLKENGNKNKFFMSFGFYSTHRRFPKNKTDDREKIYLPHEMPDCEKTREDFADYIQSARCFDESFGNIIKTLKETGLYENTLIIFTTDHGIPFPKCKCTLYEAGTEVSLIIRNPKSKNNGKRYKNLVSQVDVFPTICDILNVEKPEYLQGKSFAEVFENIETKTRDYVFTEVNYHTSYEPIRAVRNEKYKYIKYFDESYKNYNLSNIDNSLSKDVFVENLGGDFSKPTEHFYDLENDPEEKINLIDNPKYQNEIENLKKYLRIWQEKTNDPILKGEIKKEKNWKVNKKECVNPSSKDKNDYE